jgi:mono/diheme cytochrome c family protein
MRALGVCGFVLVGWMASRSLAMQPVPAMQEDVKQVYLNKCSICHGEDGAGKTAKGKKLKVKDIRSAEVQKMTQAQWIDAIVKGSGQDMDGFGKELGADMSKKLADYMRELAKK